MMILLLFPLQREALPSRHPLGSLAVYVVASVAKTSAATNVIVVATPAPAATAVVIAIGARVVNAALDLALRLAFVLNS